MVTWCFWVENIIALHSFPKVKCTLRELWVLCILSSVQGLRCTSVVHLMTSAVHLLSPCCSSHVVVFCLSSTSCASFAHFKFLYSSSAFHLWTLRRSSRGPMEAHSCPSFNPLSLINLHFLNVTAILERFLGAKLHGKADFPNSSIM